MKNYIIFFICSFLLISCKSNQESDHTNDSEYTNRLVLTEKQIETIQISYTELDQQTVTQTLKLNGKVEIPPQSLVSVSSPYGAYIKEIHVLPGKRFKKGEILAVIEDNQFIQLQEDYLASKAELEQTTSEYNRQKALNESKASSDKDFQQAKANYTALLVQVKGLEQKLISISINPVTVSAESLQRTSNIYAPFDGYVTEIFVNVGKYVSPSDVIFELVNPNDIQLSLTVFEKDWDKVKIGENVIAFTNSNPDMKYDAQIIMVGKNISRDRAIEVLAKFNEYDDNLIPGMYMNANIEIIGDSSYVLPDKSILSYEGKNYVFEKIDAHTFEMIEVQTGLIGNGRTSIKNIDKLKGKEIVLEGAYTLLMELKKGEGGHDH